jgi:hypothetical protein
MMSICRFPPPTFRPSLEVLEGRDAPSTAGVALSFAAPTFINQSSVSTSSWTSGLQIDFSVLQNAVQTQGWTSVTVGTLAKVMSDYGFAKQTYNFVSSIDNLLETGLLLGAASGAFGEDDAGIWLSTWIQLHNLDRLVNQDTGITDGVANSPISTPDGQTTTIAQLAG